MAASESLAALVEQYEALQQPGENDIQSWKTVWTIYTQQQQLITQLARLAFAGDVPDMDAVRACITDTSASLEAMNGALTMLEERLHNQRLAMETFLVAAIDQHLSGRHHLDQGSSREGEVRVPLPSAMPAEALPGDAVHVTYSLL